MWIIAPCPMIYFVPVNTILSLTQFSCKNTHFSTLILDKISSNSAKVRIEKKKS